MVLPYSLFCGFFFYCCGDHRDLHSFPTRRSSDLALATPTSLPGKDTSALAVIAVSSPIRDRKSTRLNSSHVKTSYAVFCQKKKNNNKYDDHSKTKNKKKTSRCTTMHK